MNFQGLASVFNISLGLVSWWTPKESDRYNRLIQLRVFAFCLNILHAYITGPIVYQSEEVPLMSSGKIQTLIGSNGMSGVQVISFQVASSGCSA